MTTDTMKALGERVGGRGGRGSLLPPRPPTLFMFSFLADTPSTPRGSQKGKALDPWDSKGGTMNDPNRGTSPVPEKIRDWLSRAVSTGASDLHLIVGYPPVLRLHGDLTELPEPKLTGKDTRELLGSLCPPEAFARLQGQKNVDFSFDLAAHDQVTRFRANVFYSGRQLGACFRVIPTAIPSFDWAGFPEGLAHRLAFLRDGLVIVTGATGSGKTTTM